MPPEAIEQSNVMLTGYHSLEDRPGFKIDLLETNGRLYTYLAHLWHSGWSIVNVTDSSSPELVKFIEGPADTMTKQIQIADETMVTGLERPRDGSGPVGEEMNPENPSEGAYIWDLSNDPLDPELRGHSETGGDGTYRNFYNGGKYAYMCAKSLNYERSIIAVVDISGPDDPREVNRWWWPGQSADGEEEAEESFYFHGPAYVEDNRAFISYGRVGGLMLDVSDLMDPTLLNRLDIANGLGSWLGVHSYIPVHNSDLAVINTEAINERLPLEGGEALNYTFIVDVSDEREFSYADG